jgi:hypothetical protein
MLHAQAPGVRNHPSVTDEDVHGVALEPTSRVTGQDPSAEVLYIEPLPEEVSVADRDGAKGYRLVTSLGQAVTVALGTGVEGHAHRPGVAIRRQPRGKGQDCKKQQKEPTAKEP